MGTGNWNPRIPFTLYMAGDQETAVYPKETLQWQTGYSPRPPTSCDRNTVWHVDGLPAVVISLRLA